MRLEIGHRILRLDDTDSTNDELTRRTNENSDLEAGTVIVARNQTNGKGLGDNSWISQAGENLTLSVLLRPDFLGANEQFALNMAVSLAVFEVMSSFFPELGVKIKWPNDIYIDKKKIAGILINHSISGPKIIHSIVGIGVNVNQSSFPVNLPNPVSMAQLSGNTYPLEEVLSKILKHLDGYYSILERGHSTDLREAYKYALLGLYKWLKFKKGQEILSAKITGISELGLLMLETQEGEILECDLKDVEFLV